jgi:hypothetical protein
MAGFKKNAVKTLVKPTAMITVSNSSKAEIAGFWVKLLETDKKTNGLKLHNKSLKSHLVSEDQKKSSR